MTRAKQETQLSPSPPPASGRSSRLASSIRPEAGPAFLDPSLGRLVDRFGSWLVEVGKTEATVRAYAADVRCLFRSLRATDLASVTDDRIGEYLARFAVTSRIRKQAAVRKLGAFLALNVGRHRSEGERLAKVGHKSREWKSVQARSPERIATLAEAERIVAAARSPRDKTIVALLAYVGLRVCELHSLTGRDVEFMSAPGRTFSLRPRVSPRHEYFGINLPFEVEAFVAERSGSPVPLFPNKFGDAISKRAIRVLVAAAGERAGVRISPCQLRASVAARLVDRGMPATDAAFELGLRVAPRWLVARERATIESQKVDE